ncbi:MAG: EAL domain-containing protein [Chloroflexota bacterium]|nr:EAL domain-containing protein [Chloroflexota bacterium]
MKGPSRISVRAATMLLIAAVIAVMTLIVIVNRFSTARHNEARTQADRAITNSSRYEDALGNAYNEWVTVVAYFTLHDPSYIDSFKESRASVETSLSALRDDAALHDPGQAATLDQFIATHARFADTDQQVIKAVGSGDLTAALSIAINTGLAVDSTRFLAELRQQIEDQRAALRAAQAHQQDAENFTLRWSLGLGALCAGLLTIAGLASYQWITRPLRRASAATRAIAAGDLSARVPIAGPSELANLAVDANTMAVALIRRSDELTAYLSKDLEARSADLERANQYLALEVDERKRAQEALARTLDAERDLEQQLRHQAFHDPLTNLANRARFMDRLDYGLERARKTGNSLAVLFMDVDDFKSVNDSLGHPAGDRLLKEVATRLNSSITAGDTAARVGGDEFAVLLEDVRDVDDATMVAERVIEALRPPLVLDETEVFVRGSIGVVVGTGSDVAEELVRRADIAMYVAKADGKDRFAPYTPSMEESILGRLELAGELQRAVERGEFVLHYQPSIVLSTGKVGGVEALLRWNHPTRGFRHPSEFIPVAESTGLILPIGEWVLREACMQGRRWQEEFPSDPLLTIAVNVSARQVHQPGLLDIVSDALRESRLPPESLVLEITENLMMRDVDLAIGRLNELKRLGIRIAIDDFGTGYSSLSYLRRFPVDILKIDKSFIDGVSHKGTEQELTQSIIELGQTLHLEIVAEGIEHAEQLGWLRSRDCDLGQGFYFSRPVGADALAELLRASAEDVQAA